MISESNSFISFNRFKGITGDTHGYDYSYNPCYGYGFVGTDGCTGTNNAVSLNHNTLPTTIGIKCSHTCKNKILL